jgi:hypothetical protein
MTKHHKPGDLFEFTLKKSEFIKHLQIVYKGTNVAKILDGYNQKMNLIKFGDTPEQFFQYLTQSDNDVRIIEGETLILIKTEVIYSDYKNEADSITHINLEQALEAANIARGSLERNMVMNINNTPTHRLPNDLRDFFDLCGFPHNLSDEFLDKVAKKSPISGFVFISATTSQKVWLSKYDFDNLIHTKILQRIV